MNLNGKIVLISGGARMGEGLGKAFAERGCSLVFSYRRSADAAKEARDEIISMGAEADIVPLDVSKKGASEKAVAFIKKRFGGLDIILNMASIYDVTPLDKLSDSIWQENLEANLSGGLRLIRAAAKELRDRKGRVINFADWLAESGRPRYTSYLPYYVTKKAVIGMTEALALELAPRVLVNAIAPGPILPPPSMSAKEKSKVISVTPLRRWGGVEAIAQAVLFLSETDFVTGECICVDGGRHLY